MKPIAKNLLVLCATACSSQVVDCHVLSLLLHFMIMMDIIKHKFDFHTQNASIWPTQNFDLFHKIKRYTAVKKMTIKINSLEEGWFLHLNKYEGERTKS